MPAGAARLYVRSFGSLTVAFIVELQNDFVFGLDGAPVACSQPMVEPCENQKHAWPTLHLDVPFLQSQPQPSGALSVNEEDGWTVRVRERAHHAMAEAGARSFARAADREEGGGGRHGGRRPEHSLLSQVGRRLAQGQQEPNEAGGARSQAHRSTRADDAQKGFFCHCGSVCSMELRQGGRSSELWPRARTGAASRRRPRIIARLALDRRAFDKI